MTKTTNISPFAQSVYDLTKKIPKGKITTYKQIAKALGKPKACQAVGTALSKNPFAPTVPCHRVIASDWTIGGFFGTKNEMSPNVQKKLDMLKKEGIEFNGSVLKDDAMYRKKVLFIF